MKTEKQVFGDDGEQLATDFYIHQQYVLRDKNWRYGHLEVDIIVENEKEVVFCEVKTRSASYMGAPEEFVTKQKQNNMIRAANYYISLKHIEKEVRFDVVSIIKSKNRIELKHIPNAFLPSW